MFLTVVWTVEEEADRRTGHESMKPLPPLTQMRSRRAAPPPSPADAISARCTHPCGRCTAAAWQPHAAPSPAPPPCVRLRATADRPARGACSASVQPRPRPLRLAAPASAPPRPRPLHPPAATRSHHPRGSSVVAAPRRGPSRGGRRGARWGMGSEEGRRSETGRRGKEGEQRRGGRKGSRRNSTLQSRKTPSHPPVRCNQGGGYGAWAGRFHGEKKNVCGGRNIAESEVLPCGGFWSSLINQKSIYFLG
ncbi:hypothetical protein PVAP13_3KG569250 [Panicum virgatum]|uniref:Uncharacterized protein n=1 Tax=Panicum virgatum TaxID=38727 RepID=A0A8T0V9N2_PANVG|nr:hypothetical protein PVAP13_3KG569250 [Panicum virgatum]